LRIIGAHFHTFFFYNILIFDVPQYSHIFHYIKGIRPAIYFDNQKSLHIIFKGSHGLSAAAELLVIFNIHQHDPKTHI